MIVNGKRIAREILDEIRNQVSHMDQKPHAMIFACAPNFETKRYLKLKQEKAGYAGIDLSVVTFPEDVTTHTIVQAIKQGMLQTQAIIVQLPLPSHIDTEEVLAAIDPQYDADGIHYDPSLKSVTVPPVVGAVAEIALRHDILFTSLQVVVVGQGRLVGLPVSQYMKRMGAIVTVVTKETSDIKRPIATADVLVLGAGVPQLITPDMIKEGVIIFDAGTSESNGVLVGDAHRDCERKASFFTPVPGGIGPITVAVLLRNVVQLHFIDNEQVSNGKY